MPSTILPQSSAPADKAPEALYSRHGGDEADDRSRTQAFGCSSSNSDLGIDDTARNMESQQLQSPTPGTTRPTSMEPSLPGKQSEQSSEHSPLLLSAPPAYLTATCNSSCSSRDNSGALDESKSAGGYGSTVPSRSERSLQYHGQQSMGVPVDIDFHGNENLRRSLGTLARLLLAIGALVICVCLLSNSFGSMMTKEVQPSGHDSVSSAKHLQGQYQRPYNS